MHLLVLGGTVFLGRNVVAAALAAGHAVTIFHRGVSALAADERIEVLHGDRDGDVGALAGRRFDAVVDCSGYTADQLRRSGDVLRDHVAHYLFVSSRSVYRDLGAGVASGPGAPLLEGHDDYGAAKARAEEAITASMPGRVTILRPGLIVGPFDPTGRFTYWPLRIHRGGDVLAPGRPGRDVQCVDARDLARWLVALAERPARGVHDVVGPTMAMGHLLDAIRRVVGGDARLHWLSDEVLLAAGVAPWTELPLWLPENDANFDGLMQGRDERAVAAGLTKRPVDETIVDTLRWALRADARTPRAVATMTPQHEQLLLMTEEAVP